MNKKQYPNLESEKNYQNNLYFEVDTEDAIYTGQSLKGIIDTISDDLHSDETAKAYLIECYFSRYNQKVLSDKHLQIFNKFLAAKLKKRKYEDDEEIEDDPMGFELARKELQDQLL